MVDAVRRTKRIVYLSLLASLLAFFGTNTASLALSQNDINSIYNDSVWYDPNDTSTCGISASTPGQGAPDGAQFPNLDPKAMGGAINTWIAQQNPNSKLKGLGDVIVAGGAKSNVSPFLIVAIAREESSLSDPGDFNVSQGNNSFGRTATESQPHFSGSRLWYKWSSVEASVDYTASENQGAAGGGDMASYLRAQYGSQLDGNNLSAMILLYAPPSENDTGQYIANVQKWISDLIGLTSGGGSTSGSTSGGGCTSVGCPGGTTATGNAAILCEAKKYDGIYYKFGGGHEAYSTFRQVCPEEAIASAAGSSTPDSPGPCATDCSGLVSVAVDAAFNLSYVWSIDGAMVGDGSQYWQSVPIAQAQAGDIVTTPEHVEIVDHIQGSTVYTFGSHHTGSRTSLITTPVSYWTSGAYHWTGPGAGQ